METVADAQNSGQRGVEAEGRTSGAIEVGDEAKITSHRIFAAFDTKHRGLEALHQDLFDSNPQVVLSSLEALAALGDNHSLAFVARLLNRQDETTRAAAARALGRIGRAPAVKLLSELFTLTKSDRIRCAVLEGLVEAAPTNGEVVSLIQEQATSRFVSPVVRTCAGVLLIKIRGAGAMSTLLSLARDGETEALYELGRDYPQALPVIINHGMANWDHLSPSTKVALIGVTAAEPASSTILLKGFSDVDSSVRGAAYAAIGRDGDQSLLLPNLIPRLIEHQEPNPTLEEELLAAISRIEAISGIGSIANSGAIRKILSQIQALFATLVEGDKSAVSDSHELGWLMNRAREYLEFYASQDFRASLLRYLKGDSYHTPNELIAALKASAVRVEVRHFDGFRALAEIIRTPRRRGIAFVMREVTSAHLGMRDPFNRLIRLLRLTRLINGVGAGAKGLFIEIFRWANDARLFRLAEGALYALARVDANEATAICRKAIEPPLGSKILAIATVRLLKELVWGEMEPAIVRLLRSSEDSHVLLNLIDALSNTDLPKSMEILKAMISLLQNGDQTEVVQQVGSYLATQQVPNLIETVFEGFEKRQPWRQQVMLGLVERKITQEELVNQDGLTELLYRILREGTDATQPFVAVLLLRLGDDYAAKVLKDIVRDRSSAGHLAVAQHLKGTVTAEIAPMLYPLLIRDNPALHEALRSALLNVTDEETRECICQLTLALRHVAGAEGADSLMPAGIDEEIRVDLQKEKQAFRFEREFLQEVAVLFTDIQGYSKKAQVLSSLQLTALIQDYESILLPTTSAHHGELIKRMGDGHLFIFPSPMDATLAALRLQKALKRFNTYREESLRLTVRVGVHFGKVVRKDGDVLGNHVNIASRLESSAKGGSILISEAVFERLEGHILCNEIGLIRVKNISEPIKVYEPYEIALELPEELDPLRTPATPTATAKSGSTSSAPADAPEVKAPQRQLSANDQFLSYLSETFTVLNRLCIKAEKSELAPSEIRRELGRRWQGIRSLVGKTTDS